MKVVFSIILFLTIFSVTSILATEFEEFVLKRLPVDNENNQKSLLDKQASSTASDWTMFQYNAQHTGNNDHSTIEVPLDLKWSVLDTVQKINQVTTVGDKLLIVYGYNGQVRVGCLNAADAEVQWMWELGFGGDYTQASYSYGNVYVQVVKGGSGFVAAFDMQTGDSLWLSTFPSQGQDHLAPTVWGGQVLAGGGTYGGLFCYDAYDGSLTWKKLGTDAQRWTPAAWGNYAYSWTEGLFIVWHLYTGEIDWFIDTDFIVKRQNKSFLLSDMGVSAVIDTIDLMAYCMYAADHYLFAFDLAAQSVAWIDSAVPHGYGKCPTLYEDYLFVTQWGYLQAYNRFTGEKLWEFDGNDSLKYAPVVANGYLFVSSHDNTYALDIATQTVDWSYPVGGELSVSDKNLYVSDSIWYNLYAFGDISTPVEEDELIILPTDYGLEQNYPNPFNPTTQIDFSVPTRSLVEISIYNALGQHVKTLVKKNMSAGNHSVIWDGSDKQGNESPSGVYFYKLEAGEFVDSKKMLLVR